MEQATGDLLRYHEAISTYEYTMRPDTNHTPTFPDNTITPEKWIRKQICHSLWTWSYLGAHDIYMPACWNGTSRLYDRCFGIRNNYSSNHTQAMKCVL